MKMWKYLFSCLIACLILSSCVKDPPPVCNSDPRSPIVGNYMMTDSVFFIGDFEEIREYELIVTIDSLGGDSILLENIFDYDFGLDLYGIYVDGNFSIPSQADEDAFVSGSGTLTGNTLSYTAVYDDDGYSFKGVGTKN